MASVKEIYDMLAALAPVELAESWDNVGLLVDSGKPVTKVLVTLDITSAVVEEAAKLGCELIVSHHPVIFGGLKRISQNDVAFSLVQHGISAICMHTNLDAADGGVNDVLADLFGMSNRVVFADGCGRVGDVETITTHQLAEMAQQVLHTSVKFADSGKPIRKLAVISGAGGSMFEDAVAQGADCLLTGEANHHQALDAVRLGMSLIAATHQATEWPVVPVLAQKLQTAYPQLCVQCSSTDPDPFTYI